MKLERARKRPVTRNQPVFLESGEKYGEIVPVWVPVPARSAPKASLMERGQ